MLNSFGSVRLGITAAVLLGAFVLLHSVSHGEPVIPHQSLRELPYSIGTWSGEERPLAERIVQAVSVSDYTNRVYSDRSSPPVQLYVGYYASQRTGDTIHSPKNCLPGSGWDPVRSGYTTIAVSGDRKIVVNEYVIQQDQDKELVFYWYQARGRIIANEYAGKFWMVADAITRNRTDGALVRLVTPMSDGENKAHDRLVRFTENVFPYLDQLIPN
jgi:EpsI family protein